jgi:hypothetical protein
MSLLAGTIIARAPWPVAMTGSGVCLSVLLVAALWPTSAALPVVGTVAELALAGCAAYLLDDAAAPLTDVAPQGRWRRRAPTLTTGVLVIAGAWLGVLTLLRWRDVQPPALAATVELVVAGLVAVAAAAALIRLGDPEPGTVVAPAVVLLGLGLLILEGAADVSIFLAGTEGGSARAVAWIAVGIVALLVTAVAPTVTRLSQGRRDPERSQLLRHG